MLIIELEEDERRLLQEVVEERLLGMGPLIRHCLTDKRHDELLAEQAALLRLVDRLRPLVLEEVC
ncbi:MAG: hypothetical protein DCC68_03340 [Planctomycetota bacterium]|nr:MAG: hypothetical protein DCC68_03340 [Planctomycetota bacterium]